MLALVHSAGQPSADLPALAHRRLRALLVLAWEGNRLLSMRLVEYADTFRQLGAFAQVTELQLAAAFARQRALDVRDLLRARGVQLTVRLPKEAPWRGLEAELCEIANLGRMYGEACDIASHLERDLLAADCLRHHVEKLILLVRRLGSLESAGSSTC